MTINSLEYFIREAFSSLRHNGLMSIASVSTVALSLMILGLFLIQVLNLNNMASVLESQVVISVYLKDDLGAQGIKDVGTQIGKLPGVTQVTYVNKDEALTRMKQRLREQQTLLSALGETNPLPNGFDVKVDNPDRVKTVANAANQMTGVEQAKFGQEVVQTLFTVTKMIRIFGFILIVFLAMAALFIVSNTIRITVFARRKEIGIMKYVGATDDFIRWPFLIEGMILGFGGALIAVLLLSKTYSMFLEQVHGLMPFLPLIPQYPFIIQIGIFLLVIGTGIGALGSTISLKRFMSV